MDYRHDNKCNYIAVIQVDGKCYEQCSLVPKVLSLYDEHGAWR